MPVSFHKFARAIFIVLGFCSSVDAATLKDITSTVKDFCKIPLYGIAQVLGNRNLRLATHIEHGRFYQTTRVGRDLRIARLDGQLKTVKVPKMHLISDRLSGLYLYIDKGKLVAEIPRDIYRTATAKIFDVPVALSEVQFMSEENAAKYYQDVLVKILDAEIVPALYGQLRERALNSIEAEFERKIDEPPLLSDLSPLNKYLNANKIESKDGGTLGLSISGVLKDNQPFKPHFYVNGFSKQSKFTADLRVFAGYAEIKLTHQMIPRVSKRLSRQEVFYKRVPLHELFSRSGEMSIGTYDRDKMEPKRGDSVVRDDWTSYLYESLPVMMDGVPEEVLEIPKPLIPALKPRPAAVAVP